MCACRRGVIRWRSINSDYSKERNKFNAYNIRSIYAIVGDDCVSVGD